MLIVITNQESPNTDIFWQMLSDRDNEKNFIKLCKNLQTSQHLQHFFFYIKKVSAQARRNDQQELKTIKHTHSQTNRNTLEIQHNQFGCLFFVLLSGKNGGKSTIISMALLLLPFNFTSYNIFLQTVIQVILYWFIYNKWWGNSWKQLDNTFFSKGACSHQNKYTFSMKTSQEQLITCITQESVNPTAQENM